MLEEATKMNKYIFLLLLLGDVRLIVRTSGVSLHNFNN